MRKNQKKIRALRQSAWSGKVFEGLESRVLLDGWDDISDFWGGISDSGSGIDTSSSDNSSDNGNYDNSSDDDSSDNSGFDDSSSGSTVDFPPSAPAMLTAQSPSSTTVYLSWINTTTDQDSVRIERFGSNGKWQMIGRVNGDTSHFTDSTVQAGQQYSYAVVASNDAGSSDYSNIATVTPLDASDPTLIGEFGHLPGGTASVPFSFFDGDGTKVTLTMKGPGEGEVHLNSDGYDLSVTDTTLQTSFAISTTRTKTMGDDGRFAVHDLIVGTPSDAADHTALGTLSAKTTDFSGDLTVTGPAASLSLGNLTGETIDIGAAATAPKTPPPVTLSFGTVADTTVDSAIGIKSLTAVDWVEGSGAADSITAPSLGTLKTTGAKKTHTAAAVAGDFGVALDLSGAAKGATLGGATIAGQVMGSWEIDGAAGTLAAKSAAGWSLEVVDTATASGTISSLLLKDKNATSSDVEIDAASVGTMTVQGNADELELTLRQTPEPKRQALGKLTVGGTLAESAVRSAGNIGTVRVGVMDHSLLFAGIVDGVTTLPVAGDFATAGAGGMAAIGSVTLTGVKGQAAMLIDSDIAGPSIGRVTMGGDAGGGAGYGFVGGVWVCDLGGG